MKWIKTLFKPIIKFFKKLNSMNGGVIMDDNQSNQTTINPSSGLPMTGPFDSMGNTFGSSSSGSNDYWRH